VSRELRRKLRHNPTAAETRFWRLIHPLRTDGWHFRKQVELGSYYVDFACLHAGVIVEIDGNTHGDARVITNDETRDRYFRERGFWVLRFSNDDVLRHGEGVYLALTAALDGRRRNARSNPPPQPSPQGEGAGRVGRNLRRINDCPE
jgi:very-short-patch-repair endonuclease